MGKAETFYERRIDRKLLYNGIFKFFLDQVELPSGRQTHRAWIDFPNASAVVPFLDRDTIIMIEQYRYPFNATFLEIPAGKVDAGESPEDCALRELTEETGYQASKLYHLTSLAPTIAYSNEIIHVYAATDLSLTTTSRDFDEQIEVKKVKFEEILDDIRHNRRLYDAKTIIGILFAETWRKTFFD